MGCKNDFAYVLQFFSLISDSLGSVIFHFHIDIWESLILASISRDCRVMAEDTSNLKANFPNHIKSCFEQEQVKNQKAILLDLELSFKVSSMIISMRLKFFLALLWLS